MIGRYALHVTTVGFSDWLIGRVTGCNNAVRGFTEKQKRKLHVQIKPSLESGSRVKMDDHDSAIRKCMIDSRASHQGAWNELGVMNGEAFAIWEKAKSSPC